MIFYGNAFEHRLTTIVRLLISSYATNLHFMFFWSRLHHFTLLMCMNGWVIYSIYYALIIKYMALKIRGVTNKEISSSSLIRTCFMYSTSQDLCTWFAISCVIMTSSNEKQIRVTSPFVWGIHRSWVASPHNCQGRRVLMFSLICSWINGWASNRDGGDLRRHRTHYDVIVMFFMT